VLHAEETATCPTLNEPDNYHFERLCEDCDVKTLSRLNLGQVEDRHRTGRIWQDQFEAYMHLWAVLSPIGSLAEWRATPGDLNVRRVARKLLRARGLAIPASLSEVSPSELPSAA
jgi:L-serine deaminase